MMAKTESKKYDSIIIGAGISGLICGCYLARAGRKICVLEQHSKPGGYFTSFKRKDFLFDAAAHSFGNYREGGHVRKILTELGVSDLVEIQRHDPSDEIITPDFKITFHNDINVTIDELAREFPKEKNNISRFFKFLISARQVEFVKLKDKTFGYLLETFFKDKKLINALAFPVFGNGGLPPSLMHAFSGVKVFSEFLIDGGYYPNGGIQHLPNALTHIINENNGDIKYRALVKKILSDGNSVRGIEVEGGEQLLSDSVIAACDLTEVYSVLLGDDVVGSEPRTRLNGLIPSLSTFILYLGIDRQLDRSVQAGTNVWCLGGYDLDGIYSNIEKFIFNEPAAFMYRVSPDRKTVLAFMSAPFGSSSYWKEHKKRIASNFLEKIKNVYPDIKDRIVYFDAATPATLQRYTLNYKGAAFGWAKMPCQTFDIFSGKMSPLKGLYFTGHWTSIGFGLPGTCYTGYETARRILRKVRSQSVGDSRRDI